MTAKILCIEDEPEIRQAIVEELQDAGYETAEADNGQSGLATIVAIQPDIVLCDINMPVMDGTELLTNLRENHTDLADMPFVFLTAQADRSAVLTGKKLGADDYLTKPIDFELLLATVEARLGQVERMEAKKERQFVRLYKTVAVPNSTAEGDAAASVPRTEDGAATGSAVDPETRSKLISLAEANGGKIAAGRLQFIGLDVIRTEFGDRWPAFATRIYDIAEKTIARRIDEVDVFRRDENNNYVICFAQLSEAEASFKADRIAEEIREKILGACGPEGDSATSAGQMDRNAQAPLDASCAAQVSRSLRSEVHSIALSLEEVEQTESVFNVVVARLDQAASVNRLAQETTLKDIFESCRMRTTPIELRNGSETLFRLSRFDERTQLKVDGLMAGQRNTGDLVAELDMLRIGQVAEQIYGRPATSKFIEIVEIGFSTLENRRHQEKLVELLETLDGPIPNAIAFKLTGIPDSIFPSKLAALAGILRPHCRTLVIDLDRPALGNIDPVELRTPIVACRFDRLSTTLQKAPERLKSLIGQVHKGKARFLVHGIPEMEQKMRVAKTGADLLCMS